MIKSLLAKIRWRFFTASTLVAELHEPGLISSRKIAALFGLTPNASNSGKKEGKRNIASGSNC